jgi:hypothetical protein
MESRMVGHLTWQALDTNLPGRIFRAKVPGGWFVLWVSRQGIDVLHPTVESASEEHGFTFYPDPKHEWDGGSLP